MDLRSVAVLFLWEGGEREKYAREACAACRRGFVGGWLFRAVGECGCSGDRIRAVGECGCLGGWIRAVGEGGCLGGWIRVRLSGAPGVG